jgi:hypothetical protein
MSEITISVHLVVELRMHQLSNTHRMSNTVMGQVDPGFKSVKDGWEGPGFFSVQVHQYNAHHHYH